MKIVLIGIIIYIMIRSVIHFITFQGIHIPRMETNHRFSISFEIFYTLIMIYFTVLIGFGLIYFLLSFYELTLVEAGIEMEQSKSERLFRCFYFSGVTLLTIGYGDITPIGIGRIVAIVQALIGYILPTAFVLRLVHLNFELKRSR